METIRGSGRVKTLPYGGDNIPLSHAEIIVGVCDKRTVPLSHMLMAINNFFLHIISYPPIAK